MAERWWTRKFHGRKAMYHGVDRVENGFVTMERFVETEGGVV